MARFIPTKQSNPCPVCGDTSGDCRTTEAELVLCHTYPDGGVLGWDYKGVDKGQGIWGMYAPATEHLPKEEKDRWQAEQDRKRRERLAAEAQKYRNGLSRAERDKNIRAIAAYVGLNSRHHQQLLDRGLTPETIETGLYFSVCPDQPLPQSVSDKMPGVGYRSGKKVLISAVTGYACVAFNESGQAIGFQVRDENPKADNKYRWAKSSFSSHLQDGELPLTVRGDGSTAWLTEGILKPDIATDRHGIRCMGSPGGNFLKSESQFKKNLGDCEKIIIAPDGGDILNRHVYQRWCKLIKYLGKSGYDVAIAWWEQITKGSPDIDELSSLDGVQYLSPKEWHKLAFQSQQDHKKAEQSKAVFEGWRQFTPDTALQLDFLTGDALIKAITPHLTDAGLAVHIQSGLGTNKTGSTLQLLNEYFSDRGVIMMSDINRLLYQTVGRTNDREKYPNGRTLYHLHRDDAYDFVVSDEWLAACFQSLQRWLDDGYFDGKILVIDEICSVLRSFLDGDTMKREGMQGAIAHKLEALFKRCSLILCLDGNLNDATADLITKLSGKPALKIQNTPINPRHYQINTWDDRNLLTAFGIEQLKAGYKTVFASDNAAQNRLIYKQLLRDGVQPEQMVIIDKDSTPEECPPELLEDPTQYLLDHPEVICILYSPAACRGFDFDGEAIRDGISLFDYLIGAFEGIISVDQVDQMLFRFRDEKLQRHCWIAETGKPNPRPYSYSKQFEQHLEAVRLVAETIPTEARDLATDGLNAVVQAWQQSPFVAYEKDMRMVNECHRETFRVAVLDHLKNKGCTIAPAFKPDSDLIDASADGDEKREAIKAQMKAEQKAETKRKAAAMAIAPAHHIELESLKAADPEKYGDITHRDIDRKNNYELTLPGFTTSESFTPENLVQLEQKPETIQQLTRFVMLAHEEKAIAKLEAKLHNIVTHHRDTGLTPWLGDLNLEALRIKTYNDLLIRDFIQRFQTETFTKDTPEAIELFKTASRKAVRRRLGLSVGKDIIKGLGKLIKPLGFTLETLGTGKTRRYKIKPVLSFELHHQIRCSLHQKIIADHTPKVNWKSLENGVTDHPLVCIEKRDKVLPTQAHTEQGLQPISLPKKNQLKKTTVLATEQPPQIAENPQADHNLKPEQTVQAIASENDTFRYHLVPGNQAIEQSSCTREQPSHTTNQPSYSVGEQIWFYSQWASKWLLGSVQQVLSGSQLTYRVLSDNGTGDYISFPAMIAPV